MDLISPLVDYISPLYINGQVAHISRVKPAKKQFKLNLPVDLREAIERRTETSQRKLTAEIIFLLYQAVRRDQRQDSSLFIADEHGAYTNGSIDVRCLAQCVATVDRTFPPERRLITPEVRAAVIAEIYSCSRPDGTLDPTSVIKILANPLAPVPSKK